MSEQLGPVIHALSRLRIMTTLTSLNADESLSFSKLKQLLNMANGNLSAHLTKLEDANYIPINKTFEGKNPPHMQQPPQPVEPPSTTTSTN